MMNGTSNAPDVTPGSPKVTIPPFVTTRYTSLDSTHTQTLHHPITGTSFHNKRGNHPTEEAEPEQVIGAQGRTQPQETEAGDYRAFILDPEGELRDPGLWVATTQTRPTYPQATPTLL